MRNPPLTDTPLLLFCVSTAFYFAGGGGGYEVKHASFHISFSVYKPSYLFIFPMGYHLLPGVSVFFVAPRSLRQVGSAGLKANLHTGER